MEVCAADGDGAEHEATSLQARLKEAEAELRRRREERLAIENKADAEHGGATDAGAARRAARKARTVPEAIPEEAFEALASHSEPAPPALRRLAEVLMLLLEAKVLVDLGDHKLPGLIPWKNVQLLLAKPWGDRVTVSDIQSALAVDVYGPRLRAAARERFLRGERPLTRKEVASADARCACIFDFVDFFVGDATSPEEGDDAAAAPLAGRRDRGAAAAAAAAVAAQEQEVARLRRTLRTRRAAKAGDEAAVAETGHAAPSHAEATLESSVFAQSEKGREARKDAKMDHDAENLAKQRPAAEESERLATDGAHAEIEQKAEEVVRPELPRGTERVGRWETPSECATGAVTASCCQSLQYRLNETAVPELQEAVLVSMQGALMEPRLGLHRYLVITGFAESREESDTAIRRAEAVRDWLATHGASEEQLHVEGQPPSERRGCRRVELKLIDSSSIAKQAAVRPTAVAVDSEVVRSQAVERVRDHLASGTPGPPAEASSGILDVSSPVRISTEEDGLEALGCAPHVLVEEEGGWAEDAGVGRRGVRVTFASASLDLSDTKLEVGTEAVRLASLSQLWPAIEAPLPFAVEPSTAGAPRFSRRKGTLTLQLEEALGLT